MRQSQLFEPQASSGSAAMLLAGSRRPSSIPRRSPARLDTISTWRPFVLPQKKDATTQAASFQHSIHYTIFTKSLYYTFNAFFVSASASSILEITSSISCSEITAVGSKRIVFALTRVPAVITRLANKPLAVS